MLGGVLARSWSCGQCQGAMEAAPGFEPGIRALQARALPLGYAASGALQAAPPNGSGYRGVCLASNQEPAGPAGGSGQRRSKQWQRASAAGHAQDHPVAGLVDRQQEIRLGGVAEAGRQPLWHEIALHRAQ